MPVQHPDCPSQVPPGRGQYQKIIHVPGIRHMAVSAEDVVGFCQVEGGQQGSVCNTIRPFPLDAMNNIFTVCLPVLF